MASKVMAEEADMVDVLVIGAGPGGGSAAIHSARAGLKTVRKVTVFRTRRS